MDKIRQRLNALREIMHRENLDAYYIPGTDPHMSEYLPARWKNREFISGFTGSYGEVLVTNQETLLWTDTRYFIQAEEQLQGTGFEMMKLRVPDAITFDDWLVKNLEKESRVGVHPQFSPFGSYRNLIKKFNESGIELVFTSDLLNEIWENRPELPSNEIFELDIKYSGQSRDEKFAIISKILQEKNADLQVITALDELAWTFNLRGGDVDYTPVFVGYGIVGEEEILFVDPQKLSSELTNKLKSEGVRLYGYDDIIPFLESLTEKKVLLDPALTNVAIYEACAANNKIILNQSIPLSLKAVKNETELDGFRKAMEKDGAALVKFLYWLKHVLSKEKITEYTVGRKLAEFRAEGDEFMGESFPPIVGYKNHGAIVHLSVDEENALPIEPEGLLLFDSGGHYLHGTTDITRTIVLGQITDRQRRDFTLVLKGMIALSKAVFSFGTKGCHLDILARKALWEHGLNYGHGTGHGVGHFLAVHEGPVSIRQEYNEKTIVPGMVMSNEPGFYRTGEYGIRIENLIVCIEKEETEFGRFLGFETLTLCPIDITAVDINLLTEKEKTWINNYHKEVRERLKGLLTEELNEFLNEMTIEIE